VITNNNEYIWVEKYRPQTINDIILPDDIKNTLLSIVENGNIGNYIFNGTSGTGKTTAAYALCNEINADVLFIKTPSESSIDLLRTKLTQFASSVSLDGNLKVIILDEADRSNDHFQTALNTLIEAFSANTRFILTTNNIHRLIPALISRCKPIEFKIAKQEQPKLATQLLKRVQEILTENNIEFDKKVIQTLIIKYFPDCRRIINELQYYSSTGAIIDVGILANLSSDSLNEVIEFLKEKDFTKARKWVANNSNEDPLLLFKAIYNKSITAMKPESIPELVLILAKYGFQSTSVGDQEINNIACLVEIMSSTHWQ